MPSAIDARLAYGIAIAWPLFAGTARAAGHEAEGTYGRIEGDVTLVAGLGAVLSSTGTRAAVDLRARYLDTACVFASYEDGAVLGTGASRSRLGVVGLELRPLFLIRWLSGIELERAAADLTVDSIGLELGGTLSTRAAGSDDVAAGLQISGGLEVALAGHATGPWLGIHGGLRWSPIAGAATSSPPLPWDREVFVSLTIDWHVLISAHLVDVGDEAPR